MLNRFLNRGGDELNMSNTSGEFSGFKSNSARAARIQKRNIRREFDEKNRKSIGDNNLDDENPVIRDENPVIRDESIRDINDETSSNENIESSNRENFSSTYTSNVKIISKNARDISDEFFSGESSYDSENDESEDEMSGDRDPNNVLKGEQSDFKSWKKRIYAMLRSKELLVCVKEPERASEKQKAKAFSIIIANIDNTVLRLVKEEECPLKLMTELEKRYSKEDSNIIVDARTALAKINIDNFASCKEYYDEVSVLVNSLESAGVTVSKSEEYAFLLAGFKENKKYDHVRTAAEAVIHATPADPKILRSLLKSEDEKKLKSNTSVPSSSSALKGAAMVASTSESKDLLVVVEVLRALFVLIIRLEIKCRVSVVVRQGTLVNIARNSEIIGNGNGGRSFQGQPKAHLSFLAVVDDDKSCNVVVENVVENFVSASRIGERPEISMNLLSVSQVWNHGFDVVIDQNPEFVYVSTASSNQNEKRYDNNLHRICDIDRKEAGTSGMSGTNRSFLKMILR